MRAEGYLARLLVMQAPSPISRMLARAPTWAFSGYAIFAAFSVYFCMYAFRRPFAVAMYEGECTLPLIGALQLKILYIIAQTCGYCLSKFIGIKVVSEVPPRRRGMAILGAIGIAELALFLFGIVPAPYGAIMLFLNGLPLGMVWGLVFGFLEGRRVSDLLGAGLSTSYIVASGAVKAVGRWLLENDLFSVSEAWMPAAVGLLFTLPLLFAVWMLQKLPPPSEEDESERTRRRPMNARARRSFLLRYWPGLVALILLYYFLTAYRDFRDSFAREIWDALGFESEPSIFATAELPIALGVMVALGALYRIRHNRRALLAVHLLMGAGAAMIGVSTWLYEAGVLPPAPWMVLVGLGLYLAYVPYGCILFDRMIAVLGVVGTAGFMIYVTDAVGYSGSVALLLYKNFAQPDLSWLEFFIGYSYFTSALTLGCFTFSGWYFIRKRGEGADGRSGSDVDEPAT